MLSQMPLTLGPFVLVVSFATVWVLYYRVVYLYETFIDQPAIVGWLRYWYCAPPIFPTRVYRLAILLKCAGDSFICVTSLERRVYASKALRFSVSRIDKHVSLRQIYSTNC